MARSLMPDVPDPANTAKLMRSNEQIRQKTLCHERCESTGSLCLLVYIIVC